MTKQLSLLQGTLDMLILKAVSLGPQHGYGVLLRIQQLAKGSLQIEQGSLYPALCRLEHQGFIQSKWGESEHNRKAKFYQLTAAGRKQLRFETENWNRLTDVTAAHFERCAGRHMNLVARIRSLLEGLLHRRQVEESMQAELQFHVNAYLEDLVRSGVSRTEALRRARIEFGAVEKVREECRQARGLQWFDDFRCDLRYVVRMFRRNPGFTAVAVITLALGIGANTAVFNLLDALVLRNLPVPHPEQLVRFGVHNPYAFDISSLWISLPMFREIRREQRVFSTTCAWSNDAVENVDANGTLSLHQVSVVTGNYYSELGAVSQLGRLNGPEDVNLKTDDPVQVVVLSYGFWQRYYAGANDVVGKTLKIEMVPFTIIDVTRKVFNGASLDVRSGVTVALTNSSPETASRM